MSIDTNRLETLIIARAYTMRAPATAAELASPLARFSPGDLTPAAWSGLLADTTERLRGSVLTPEHRLIEPDELRRRIGLHNVTKWQQLAEQVLPAMALGIAASDGKTLAKLKTAEAWAAAIVGRARGTWTTGSPPSASAQCDAFAWNRLGLTTKPKRLPGEVRSLFLQQELGAAGSDAARLLRQLAARELAVPRSDGRALKDGLVRRWLAGRALGESSAQVASPAPAPRLTDEVLAVARTAREGVFGDRKVFIAEIWNQLRKHPQWSSLTLDELKQQLLAAHRAGDVVLARADLVAAMDPALVAASEIDANGATFHFVLREARA